jgi:NADH:ubiquinone oxidoreductase subunit 6 (subunit J)
LHLNTFLFNLIFNELPPPLGGLLLRDLVLPFEAVSLILTAALLGAVFFSGKNESSGARR